MSRLAVCGLTAVCLLLTGCPREATDEGLPSVVAAFYPLAWAAEEIGGSRVRVTNLTPPGGEPHEMSLTANQRNEVNAAAVLLLLGRGFQPEVERAARDADGEIVDLLDGLDFLPSKSEELTADPHVWLDPVLMSQIVEGIGDALSKVDPGGRTDYSRRAAALKTDLEELDAAFRAGLGGCALKTLITTHEAFDYLAKRYGLTEIGLTGVTPEAEPTAERIEEVRQAAGRGEVGAIFYEASDEGKRGGENLAADVGVSALPLHTLESDPPSDDYLSQMRENLAQLQRGLRCT